MAPRAPSTRESSGDLKMTTGQHRTGIGPLWNPPHRARFEGLQQPLDSTKQIDCSSSYTLFGVVSGTMEGWPSG